LAILLLVTFIGGWITFWYTYKIEDLLSEIIDKHVVAFQSAEALETALVNQKGFVSYYFQDGDPNWLRQLGEYRQIFKERLKDAVTLADTKSLRQAINNIGTEYERYITGKDKVIELYKSGEREAGALLHQEVREHFFKTLDLCEEYKELYRKRIEEASVKGHSDSRKFRILALSGIVAVGLAGVLLVFFLAHYILDPVRRLAAEANRAGDSEKSRDEVKSLGITVRGLIEDIDLTQSELEKSRENLVQAEKLAQVGRLAAGVAHSIRNPLTSVNMRLFSLARTLELSGSQQEDFDVISEEIRHIDTIVQNFLEFSRRPKLKVQDVSPSDIVDTTLQLLHHRLMSYNVTVKLDRLRPLPIIKADSDQIKEVLANLIVNACEAMGEGGTIRIEEEEKFDDPLGRVAIIRLTDNGPGIPGSILDKVIQPFFTTKDEGTGLGLSIAARILAEHGGRLEINSKEAQGTTISAILPFSKERVDE
jgi:signal transduction histidine kinase